MSRIAERVVFDCNVFFQAVINANGPAGLCVAAAFERRVLLFCSSYIIEELRLVSARPHLRQKFSSLTDARVAALIENIEKVAIFVANVPEVFTFARDPDDAHYINLAIVTGSRYVVSRDKDLTDLRRGDTPEGRDFRSRFPTIEIVEPPELLRRLAEA